MAARESALAGLRVLELADAQGAYCGKLLADMGAEVLKIEQPGGVEERLQAPFLADQPGCDRSLGFLYNNTSKKSVELDLEAEPGRKVLRDLLVGADVLVTTWSLERLSAVGCAVADLRRSNPGLIVSAITGFGQFGPHSQFSSSDLVASAMSGAMEVIGYAEDPPVRLAGAQSFVVAGNLAAIGTLVALHHRSRSGRGQDVDISLQEAMLSASSICGVGKWLEDGIVPQRFGTALFAAVPSGLYPCRDGSIYLIVNRPRHWQALAVWVAERTGNEEILDPMFEGPSASRQPYRELLDIYIRELTAKYTVDEFYREGQRRHLAVTPLHTASSLAADPHLAARAFFVGVNHPGHGTLRYPGAPCRLSLTPWRIAGRAPLPGEHNAELDALLERWRRSADAGAAPASAGAQPCAEATAPLAGLRVVEFTAGMAGPWIGRYLAWCGADVIKVESRDYPDVTRLYISPGQPQLGVQPEMSPWFTDWNAGKRFVALDLRQSEGAALASQLVAQADVVIDNNANGVLEKLGLGFNRLRSIKRDLVLFSSTGFGERGPDAHYISWGPNIETLSGLAALSGFPNRTCTMTQFAYPDAISALSGLFAILCALRYRESSGRGQTLCLSQQEATIAAIGDSLMEALVNGVEPCARGNQSTDGALEGCYPCVGEERWCVFTLAGDEQWRALCALLEMPAELGGVALGGVLKSESLRAKVDAALAQRTRQRDASQLMHDLQGRGIAAGVVQNTSDQYTRDPHLRARGTFECIRHLRKGEVVAPAIPILFSETPGSTRDSGRRIGQDNRPVFCDLLGLSGQRFERYLREGVIQCADGGAS